MAYGISHSEAGFRIALALRLFHLRKFIALKGFIIDSMTFKYRRKITITEQSGNDLTDYQVLIELNSTNFDFSHAQTNGEDIRFTDASGNLLDYWIEEWDAVNETAKVWVKVPSIPANGTVDIYCYYGNSEITSASDASATFIRIIDGVVGSWHFDEGSGTTAKDTSGNDNDGTIYGATWGEGKFGWCLDFDGIDDHIEVSDSESLDVTGPITIEVWIYIKQSGVAQSFVGKNRVYTLWIQDNNEIRFADTQGNYVDTDPISEFNQWIHLVAVFNGEPGDPITSDNSQIYINGEARGSQRSGIWKAAANQGYILTMGAWYTGRDYLKGSLDEVRIYNKALILEEILDLYNNYGYTTENYPEKVLVRKYTSPEPSVSIGAEKTA